VDPENPRQVALLRLFDQPLVRGFFDGRMTRERLPDDRAFRLAAAEGLGVRRPRRYSSDSLT